MYHTTGTGKTLYLCKLEVFLRQVVVVITGKRQRPTRSPAQHEEHSQDRCVHLEWLCLEAAAFPQTSVFTFIDL